GSRSSSGLAERGGKRTARQYWNRGRIRRRAIPLHALGVWTRRGNESDAGEQGKAEAEGRRGPRPADELRRSRFRAGLAADSRDGGDLRQLGIGDRAAGDGPRG